MLKRKIYDELMKWKNREHKCLLVKGQRQVGKTYIIEQFARDNYEHFVEFNLADNVDVANLFKGNLDVDTLISGMRLFHNPDDFVPGKTLLFLDEIQNCPRARSALKAFSIDGRYDVIASGSLLGVVESRLARVDSDVPPLLPMGYEEHLTMVSMDFEEFLWALKFPSDMLDDVKSCISRREPLEEVVLKVLNERFRDFMIVGGMPQSVERFVESKDYVASSDALKMILDTCRNDINRYNTSMDSPKTSECFDSIPAQLSETNKRFTYSRIGGGGGRSSADKYKENLLWIKDAGYGNFCYALTQPVKPLECQVSRDVFRVYLSDTGILSHMIGVEALRAIYRGDGSFNKGALVENVVAEGIMKSGLVPYYYRKSSEKNRMEIDFVVEMGGEIFVIEVKSGKSRDSPSFDKVGNVFDVQRRIKFENSNIRVDADGMEHYPIFVSSFMRLLEKEWDGPRFV